MLKEHTVKVVLGDASLKGDTAPRWALRFDMFMLFDGYRKIDPKLAEIVERMEDNEDRIQAQLQWQVSANPCILTFAPTKEALMKQEYCTKLGEVSFKPKITVVKRKGADKEDPLEPVLLAHTSVPANERTSKFVLTHWKTEAWCRITTPQQEAAPQEGGEGEGECPKE